MSNIFIKLKKGDFFGRENIDFALKRLKAKIDTEEVMETVKSKKTFETVKQKRLRKARKLQRKLKEIRKKSSSKN